MNKLIFNSLPIIIILSIFLIVIKFSSYAEQVSRITYAFATPQKNDTVNNDSLQSSTANHQENNKPLSGNQSILRKLMIFGSLPSKGSSGDEAASMADKLKEFSRSGIDPIVVIEPYLKNGQVIDFKDISGTDYQNVLEDYFFTLKKSGISEKQMGLWVPLPEPNTDAWGKENSNPDDFVAAFNAYSQKFKKYFPAAKLSVLLDNETYLWERGDTITTSLSPYINGIDKTKIDSFGLQGFPWSAPTQFNPQTVYDATDFLNANRAIEAAQALAVKSIWFNTGTFSSMYAANSAQTVSVNAAQRTIILNSILKQLITAKSSGLEVMVNIFAEDKSKTDEGIDWSYDDLESKTALTEFISKSMAEKIEVSLFFAN